MNFYFPVYGFFLLFEGFTMNICYFGDKKIILICMINLINRKFKIILKDILGHTNFKLINKSRELINLTYVVKVELHSFDVKKQAHQKEGF